MQYKTISSILDLPPGRYFLSSPKPEEIESASISLVEASNTDNSRSNDYVLQHDSYLQPAFTWRANCSNLFMFDCVYDELAIGLRYSGISGDLVSSKVQELLISVGLENLVCNASIISPFDLSGGQQQRLVAAIIASRRISHILLLDSFVHVDLHGKQLLWNFISNYGTAHNATIVFTQLIGNISIEKGATELIPGALGYSLGNDLAGTQMSESLNVKASNISIPLGPIPISSPMSIEIFNCVLRHGNRVIGISIEHLRLHRGHCYVLAGPNGGGKSSLCQLLSEQTSLPKPALLLYSGKKIANPVRDLVYSNILWPIFQDINVHYRTGSLGDLIGTSTCLLPLVFDFKIERYLSLDLIDVPRWVKQVINLLFADRSNCPLLVLDEPLDDYIVDYIYEPIQDLFLRWRSQSRTVLLATHSPRLATAVASDYLWVENGKLHDFIDCDSVASSGFLSKTLDWLGA